MPRRLGLVAVVVQQRVDDRVALDRFQRREHPAGDGPHLGRQVVGGEHARAAAGHRLAQHLVELLDVAGPPVAHEQPHGLGRAGQLGAAGEPRDEVRHQLGHVLDVVAQRRHHDRAREELQQVDGVVGAAEPPGPDGGDQPGPIVLGGLAVGLQRVDELLAGLVGQLVEVGEHEGAAPGGELLGDVGDPAGPVVLGVEDPQVRRRGAELVGGARDRGLAGARLALQHEPLAAVEVPVDGLATLRPQQAAADRGGQRGDRRRAGGPRLRHLGRGQLHLQHAARGAPVDPARPHLHAGDDPRGQVEQQHPALGVHRLDGAGDERGLVGGVDQLARPVVAHDEVGAHREHRACCCAGRR